MLKVIATKNKTRLGVLMLFVWLHLHTQRPLIHPRFPTFKIPIYKIKLYICLKITHNAERLQVLSLTVDVRLWCRKIVPPML